MGGSRSREQKSQVLEARWQMNSQKLYFNVVCRLSPVRMRDGRAQLPPQLGLSLSALGPARPCCADRDVKKSSCSSSHLLLPARHDGVIRSTWSHGDAVPSMCACIRIIAVHIYTYNTTTAIRAAYAGHHTRPETTRTLLALPFPSLT
jgi:hypothetical protein